MADALSRRELWGKSLAQLLLNAGSLEGVLNRTTFNFKEQMTFM